jgi:hypothetical protein
MTLTADIHACECARCCAQTGRPYDPNARSWTKTFLRRARVTDDPVGDLISDMRRDPHVPRLFGGLRDLRAYLRSRGACPEALAAVPGFHRRYRAWIDHHPSAADLDLEPPPKAWPRRDRAAVPNQAAPPSPPLAVPTGHALASMVAGVKAWSAAAVDRLTPEELKIFSSALSDSDTDVCIEYRLREGCIALVATDNRRRMRCELIAQDVPDSARFGRPTDASAGTLQ